LTSDTGLRSDLTARGGRGAVFLSYSSEDTNAAARISKGLRAADIEVWFDQSDLRGGDAWDQKIRRQIKECALFIPVISASTQARHEGYFRLEWRLADQRTHLMGRNKAFIVPVAIDETSDSGADVPESFLSVQWTRLPAGETPVAFTDRVKRLLLGNRPPESEEASKNRLAAAPEAQKQTRIWLVPVLIGVAAMIAVALWYRWRIVEKQPSTIAAVSSVSEARKLMAQALTLIDDPDTVRENYRLADELCQRALALDATDAEIWATAARVSQEMYTDTYDATPQRLEKARTQAERAIRLDPQSISAGLAVARNFRLAEKVPEGIHLLRGLLARAPNDRLVLRELARQERRVDNDAGVNEILARIRAQPGGDPRALVTEVRDLRKRGRFPEAELIVDKLLAETPVRLAYYEKFLLLLHGWSDLEATKVFIERIPPRLMQEDAFAALAAEFWMRSGDSDKALAALALVPHEYLEEFAADDPKGYFAGWAYSEAGRHTAAQAEWQKALALVEARLAADNNDRNLLTMKASLLALLGQKSAARQTWKLMIEFGGITNPVRTDVETHFRVALGELDEAISVLDKRWPTLGFAERSLIYGELRYAPQYAAIRSNQRIKKLIAEQAASLDALRNPKSADKNTTTSLNPTEGCRLGPGNRINAQKQPLAA
jgi:tetratricopeptide (TPR) repeat protein